tara:strand:- start:6035 stop:7663 length:1629 start_codon:yes stop_codon:yes gene_type:complete
MEQYNFKIRRRFYPGGEEIIPPTLPGGYVHKNQGASPLAQECTNCYFNNAGFCEYWKAPIKANFWCKKWNSSLTPFNELPAPPPCLTGYTLPILLTQDFNDIGVYTPWDGLIVQRDVINNFVYTGYNQTICVFNTSELELKRFLNFADYRVDWGDGSPPDYLNSSQTNVCHNYLTPNPTGNTVTLSQTNPWGTTRMKKIIKTPYYENPIIPNVFGAVTFAPPNLGDPIGCDFILQNYIFSGDSNPDVYDHLSLRYVDTPFPVTGYSESSQLQLFAQYGANYLPTIGNQITLPDDSVGTVTEVNDDYTAYTINYVNYIDYGGGSTYFEAMSFGINPNNVDYECCTEVDSPPGEPPCDCSTNPQIDCYICHMGIDCFTIQFYLDTGWGPGSLSGNYADMMTWLGPPDANGVYTTPQESNLYCTLEECQTSCGSGSLRTTTNTENYNYSLYSPRVRYSTVDVVSHQSGIYNYKGKTKYGDLSETTKNSNYIDLRYYSGEIQLNYINDQGEAYGLCLATPPGFNPQDWEIKTGEQYNGYITEWELA